MCKVNEHPDDGLTTDQVGDLSLTLTRGVQSSRFALARTTHLAIALKSLPSRARSLVADLTIAAFQGGHSPLAQQQPSLFQTEGDSQRCDSHGDRAFSE